MCAGVARRAQFHGVLRGGNHPTGRAASARTTVTLLSSHGLPRPTFRHPAGLTSPHCVLLLRAPSSPSPVLRSGAVFGLQETVFPAPQYAELRRRLADLSWLDAPTLVGTALPVLRTLSPLLKRLFFYPPFLVGSVVGVATVAVFH
jgi:hypothetical protein